MLAGLLARILRRAMPHGKRSWRSGKVLERHVNLHAQQPQQNQKRE
jgi:hypothetical protein